MEAVASGDVLGHAIGPHHEAFDQAAEALQHVVQQGRGAGQHDALHGRVADVALVPEGLVLHARQGIAAQQPGHAGEALGEDGVALVGHRRRAGLADPEGLLELADLGVLEVADLHREALDGAAGHGDGGQEGGVPVSLHDLRAGLVDGQAQGRQRRCLDLRRQLRVGAHGTGDLARGQVGRGRPESSARPIQLEGPGGQLEPEGDGLGVDAVRAAHHQGAGVDPCAGHDGGDGSVQAGQDEVGRGAALQGQRGVHDVAAGEPVVEVAALLADRFGDLRDEGHDVVVGGALQLGDAGHVHAGARRDGLHGGRRHVPALGESAQDRQLHPEHVLEAALLGPQRCHRRQRVAPDHALTRDLDRRSPRMMVWVRSGPTLTTATGAPASDSTAST